MVGIKGTEPVSAAEAGGNIPRHHGIPKLFCSPLYLCIFIADYGLQHLRYVFRNETTNLMVIDRQVDAHRGNIPPKITVECGNRSCVKFLQIFTAEAVGA
jgi:hypothetical protein